MDKNEIPSGIRVDKEGVWHYHGAAMFRKDIWQELYRHLKQEESGRYLVELGKERAYIEVEDTPYVIKSVLLACAEGKGEDVVYLDMPDDSREVLDPSSLHVGEGNALYGVLDGRGITARFSRAAYYQIAKHIEHDARQDSYFLSLNNHHYYIK